MDNHDSSPTLVSWEKEKESLTHLCITTIILQKLIDGSAISCKIINNASFQGNKTDSMLGRRVVEWRRRAKRLHGRVVFWLWLGLWLRLWWHTLLVEVVEEVVVMVTLVEVIEHVRSMVAHRSWGPVFGRC